MLVDSRTIDEEDERPSAAISGYFTRSVTGKLPSSTPKRKKNDDQKDDDHQLKKH